MATVTGSGYAVKSGAGSSRGLDHANGHAMYNVRGGHMPWEPWVRVSDGKATATSDARPWHTWIDVGALLVVGILASSGMW